MIDVTAAVIESGGRILITRRALDDRQGGCWEFPGGKVEPGETPQECLERELREELGLETRAGEVIAENIHGDDARKIRLIAIETRILDGSPTLSVHDRMAWVVPTDLADYRLAPADIPIARFLAARDPRTAKA